LHVAGEGEHRRLPPKIYANTRTSTGEGRLRHCGVLRGWEQGDVADLTEPPARCPSMTLLNTCSSAEGKVGGEV